MKSSFTCFEMWLKNISNYLGVNVNRKSLMTILTFDRINFLNFNKFDFHVVADM